MTRTCYPGRQPRVLLPMTKLKLSRKAQCSVSCTRPGIDSPLLSSVVLGVDTARGTGQHLDSCTAPQVSSYGRRGQGAASSQKSPSVCAEGPTPGPPGEGGSGAPSGTAVLYQAQLRNTLKCEIIHILSIFLWGKLLFFFIKMLTCDGFYYGLFFPYNLSYRIVNKLSGLCRD